MHVLPLLRFGWMLVRKCCFLLGFVRGVWQPSAVITLLTITVISKSASFFFFVLELLICNSSFILTCLFLIQHNVIWQRYYSFICLICLPCWICSFLNRDTFVLCLLNGGTSFVAGFAIFSVLGFMSYEQGLPISEVAATGKTTAVFKNHYFRIKVWLVIYVQPATHWSFLKQHSQLFLF